MVDSLLTMEEIASWLGIGWTTLYRSLYRALYRALGRARTVPIGRTAAAKTLSQSRLSGRKARAAAAPVVRKEREPALMCGRYASF